MTQIPSDLLYTAEHEWVRVQGETAVMGVTQHAAEQLGDVTYVELPEAGRQLVRGKALGVIESVKAVSDVYAPLGGTVVESNDRLVDAPELVNQSPYGEGWICRLRLADRGELSALLDAEAYGALLARDGH
jgi:glycine cleavage system H protein